jgi:hypothetical protein
MFQYDAAALPREILFRIARLVHVTFGNSQDGQCLPLEFYGRLAFGKGAHG